MMIAIRRTRGSRSWSTFGAAILVTAIGAGVTSAQTAKTTKYTYDALGRLTYVEDSQNGNRDYDYDAAGNRRNVAVGTANDGASEPAPLPPPSVPGLPTGLSMNQVADCAWNASWNAVTSATSYKLTDTSGTVQTTNLTSKSVPCPQGNPMGNRPKYLQACNPNGCGSTASFF